MENEHDTPVNNTGRIAESKGGDFPVMHAVEAHPHNVMRVPPPVPEYVLTVTNPD